MPKGERRDKWKRMFSNLALPNRILYSINIVKGERKDKWKRMFSNLALPNRILYSINIMKGERKDKWKRMFSNLTLPDYKRNANKTRLRWITIHTSPIIIQKYKKKKAFITVWKPSVLLGQKICLTYFELCQTYFRLCAL